MKNYMTAFDPLFDQILGCRTQENRMMPANIKETKENYILTMEVPGVSKENLKVSLKEGNIIITIKKEEEPLEEEEAYLVKERKFGEYSRSFYIGEDVKFEHISAKLNNGVLTLAIQKVEPEKEEEKFVDIE